MEILLDTNFCLIPFQFKLDVIEEMRKMLMQNAEIVVPDLCIEELKKLKYGNAAIEYLKSKGIKIIKIENIKNVDDSLVQYAKKQNSIIATQDLALKKKAKNEGIKTIVMRQKKYLAVA